MEERILSMLEELAKTLGVTTEYLMEVYTKQAFVQVEISTIAMWITGIILVVFTLVAIFIFIMAMIDDEGEIAAGTVGMWFFICIIPAIIFFNDLSTKITCENNPEYWAVEHLMEDIGNMITDGE